MIGRWCLRCLALASQAGELCGRAVQESAWKPVDRWSRSLATTLFRLDPELLGDRPPFLASALATGSDAFFLAERERLLALAAKYRIATIHFATELTRAGGLMSYANSFVATYREATLGSKWLELLSEIAPGHVDEWRYVPGWGQWMHFRGGRWVA
jgi:hypothetical protein